jgi:hypothetical protein
MARGKRPSALVDLTTWGHLASSLVSEELLTNLLILVSHFY